MFTKKIEIFWTNIASTMAYPNSQNGPKNGLRPLGDKSGTKPFILAQLNPIRHGLSFFLLLSFND
jgi:hypothetical protein